MARGRTPCGPVPPGADQRLQGCDRRERKGMGAGGFKNHAARAQGRDIVIAGFELRVAREWRGINASWAGIEAMFQTMVMAVDLKTMVQSTIPNVN